MEILLGYNKQAGAVRFGHEMSMNSKVQATLEAIRSSPTVDMFFSVKATAGIPGMLMKSQI